MWAQHLHGYKEAAAELGSRCPSVEQRGGCMREPSLTKVQVGSHSTVNVLHEGSCI